MKVPGYQCQRYSMTAVAIGYLCGPASVLLLLAFPALTSGAPTTTSSSTTSGTTDAAGSWCASSEYDVQQTQQRRKSTALQQESMIEPPRYDWTTIQERLKMLKKRSDVSYQDSQTALDIILGALPGAGRDIFNRLGDAILNHLSADTDIPSSEPLITSDVLYELEMTTNEDDLAETIEEVVITHAHRLTKMEVRLEYMRHNVPALDLRDAVESLHDDVSQVMCLMNTLYDLLVSETKRSFPGHLTNTALSPDEKLFMSENTISGEGLRYGEVARTRGILRAIKMDVMNLKKMI